MKRIALALFLTACGTDGGMTGVSLTADTKTGEVSIKGEKGDKGDTGEQGAAGAKGKDGVDGQQGASGTNGKDGASGKDGSQGAKGETGAAGKDGEPLPSGIWKDAITGRQWLLIQGKFTADQVMGLCSPWKQPKIVDLVPAIQHGLIVGLPIISPQATERAWTNDTPNGDPGAVTIVDANILNIGGTGFFSRGALMRLYCVKE